MKIPRNVIVFAWIGLVALLASACGDSFTAGAATVNGVSISQEQVDARVLQQQSGQPGEQGPTDEQRRQALFELIQEELIDQGARRMKITADDAAVKERLDQIKSQFPSEQEFQSELTKRGFTNESLRKAIAGSIVQEKLVEQLGEPITDEQLRQVYEQEKAQFQEVRARHILISASDQSQDAKAKREAERALEEIRDGASFASVARRVSDDPGSKEKGGDLGYLKRDQLVPEFAEAAFNARVGRPVGPVRTQFGYHIILVLKKRTTPFAEAQAGLRDRLQQQLGQSTMQKFLDGELEKATIVVNPKYGDWDAEQKQIVPHESFVPASPEPDPDQAPPFDLGGGAGQ